MKITKQKKITIIIDETKKSCSDCRYLTCVVEGDFCGLYMTYLNTDDAGVCIRCKGCRRDFK